MKSFLPILFLALSSPIFAQLNSKSIQVGADSRDYVEYIPTNYQNSEASPLVIILHGIGGTASDYATYGLNGIADTARFLPVYLQGEVNGFGQTAWNNGTLLGTTANDLAFIENIIDTMAVDYNIDRSRVYVVGISMGAIMTYKVLHHLSDKVAAAVCHIGTMSSDELANYNPSLPRPLMQVHGINDAVVPYSGNALPSLGLVPETLVKLKAVNGWNGDSTISNIPNTAIDDVTIEKIVYDCTTPLEHWKMSGAGAGHIFLFEPINDTSSMEITWHFLRDFSHPNPTLSISTHISPAINKLEVYPNPTQHTFSIQNPANFTYIKLYSIHQKLILETAEIGLIDVSELESGLYILMATDFNGQSHSRIITKQ
ncbi:MAG: PHB depolymerase family esterase [Crocinitomicaceae bacterium]